MFQYFMKVVSTEFKYLDGHIVGPHHHHLSFHQHQQKKIEVI